MRLIRLDILCAVVSISSPLLAVAQARCGHVVGVSMNADSPDATAFRAGLVWLGADSLPTQSAELAVGSASASVAEIVPLEDGAVVVQCSRAPKELAPFTTPARFPNVSGRPRTPTS